MAHPLAASFAKIERAKKELRELDLALKGFMATDPYGVVTYCDCATREEVWATRVSGAVPDDTMGLAGNIAGNLRSALDILAGRIKVTGRRKPVTKHYFPIFSDPVKYQTAGGGQIRGASPYAMSLVERLQPYHRGDEYAKHPLWIVHELDILQKHNDLVLIGAAARTQTFNLGGGPGGLYVERMTLGFPDGICPLVDGTPFFRFKFGSPDVNMQVGYAFFVAFEQTGAGHGEAVVPLLKQLIDFTQSAVETFRPLFA